MHTISLVAALFTFGTVASAAADQCGDLMATATTAAAKMNRYGAQADATTSQALTLAHETQRAVADAANACKGTEKEAALKFSAANIAGIEKALSDAKTERLRETGIFSPPDEP